jgi:hypothetical protein
MANRRVNPIKVKSVLFYQRNSKSKAQNSKPPYDICAKREIVENTVQGGEQYKKNILESK